MKTNNGSTPRFFGYGEYVGDIIFVGQGHTLDQCHRSLSATTSENMPYLSDLS